MSRAGREHETDPPEGGSVRVVPGPPAGGEHLPRQGLSQRALAALPPRSWRTSRVNSSVISDGTVSGMKLPSA